MRYDGERPDECTGRNYHAEEDLEVLSTDWRSPTVLRVEYECEKCGQAMVASVDLEHAHADFETPPEDYWQRRQSDGVPLPSCIDDQLATDGGQEKRRPLQDRLVDMSDEVTDDMDLGEVMYSGRLGYHTFYDKDSDRLLRGSRTVLHMAFDRTLEELWLDEDIIRDNQGEVTPDAIEAELLDQLERFIGGGIGRGFNERFAENVRQVLEDREMAGGEE